MWVFVRKGLMARGVIGTNRRGTAGGAAEELVGLRNTVRIGLAWAQPGWGCRLEILGSWFP